MDFKVASFRGLGRGKGFVKGEVYSILEDDEYMPILADKIEKLYHMLIYKGILRKTTDDYTLYQNNVIEELRAQLASQESKLFFLNMKITKETEERELRSHVDYIIHESLSLDDSAKLKYDEGEYYMVITPKTKALNLYLFFLMRELPERLKSKILQHVNGDDYSSYLQFLKTVENTWSALEMLSGSKYIPFEPFGEVKPYTLKLDEVKEKVKKVKESIKNQDGQKMMEEYQRELSIKYKWPKGSII